jgi:anti-sigma B factor antagonist
MVGVLTKWQLTVQRGPESVFVKVLPGSDSDAPADLAERVTEIADQHFASRVILELDAIQVLNSPILGQLIKLARQIRQRGGLLRLCGINEFNRRVVELSRLEGVLPCYGSRHEAIMLREPRKPR